MIIVSCYIIDSSRILVSSLALHHFQYQKKFYAVQRRIWIALPVSEVMIAAFVFWYIRKKVNR